MKLDIEEHEIQCEFAPAECLFCKKNIPMKSLNNHELICRKIQCSKCQLKVPALLYSYHLQNSCDYEMVKCSNNCGLEAIRKQMKTHEVNCKLKAIFNPDSAFQTLPTGLTYVVIENSDQPTPSVINLPMTKNNQFWHIVYQSTRKNYTVDGHTFNVKEQQFKRAVELAKSVKFPIKISKQEVPNQAYNFGVYVVPNIESHIFTSLVLFCSLFWQLDQSDQAPN